MHYGVDLDQLIKTHGHEPVAAAIGVTVATLKQKASGWRGCSVDDFENLADAFPEFSRKKGGEARAFKRKRIGKFKEVN